MKRFYKDVAVSGRDIGWQVTLDGRGIKTPGDHAQVVPTRALAEAMAGEWAAQGEEIDPQTFPLRDLADYAIDVVASDREDVIAGLLRYAETDTLCYRADPDEPFHARQVERWEPLLTAAEERLGAVFRRVSGVLHRPQSDATIQNLRERLTVQSDFVLAALNTLASLSASIVIALAALEPDADLAVLWNASELEGDWQVEQWGEDAEAAQRRERRMAAFFAAARFGALARV